MLRMAGFLVEAALLCNYHINISAKLDEMYILLLNSCVKFYSKTSCSAEISTKVAGSVLFIVTLYIICCCIQYRMKFAATILLLLTNFAIVFGKRKLSYHCTLKLLQLSLILFWEKGRNEIP